MLRFKPPAFEFLKHRRVTFAVSAVVLLLSIVLLATRGLNFGIDFTGGTLIEVGYQEPVALETVRTRLDAAGYDRAVVQHFGTARDILIRVVPREGEASADLGDRIFAVLADDGAELRRVEFVGPQVGEELREQGGLALLYALVGVLIYVALRFEWRFSVGAVLALAHDVIITLGIFSLIFADFDLTVLAALLAVIGYSLNDTIVVFDRIRENFRVQRTGAAESVMNGAINATISRTIVTSMTTLFVLLALFFLGGAAVHNFALALIIGILIGTYSSIYVASALALWLGVDRAVLAPVKLETGDDGSQV